MLSWEARAVPLKDMASVSLSGSEIKAEGGSKEEMTSGRGGDGRKEALARRAPPSDTRHFCLPFPFPAMLPYLGRT